MILPFALPLLIEVEGARNVSYFPEHSSRSRLAAETKPSLGSSGEQEEQRTQRGRAGGKGATVSAPAAVSRRESGPILPDPPTSQREAGNLDFYVQLLYF